MYSSSISFLDIADIFAPEISDKDEVLVDTQVTSAISIELGAWLSTMGQVV